MLIITDGEIHDMKSVIDTIVQASFYPISIIIVGVGTINFRKMEILDGNRGLTNSSGIKAARDIV